MQPGQTISTAFVIATLASATVAQTQNASPSPASSPDVLGKKSDAIAKTIVHPIWIKRPDANDVISVYPRHALRARISGRTNMRCEVMADGRLGTCLITSEDPDGEGFGAASLKLSKFFTMGPTTVDGLSIAGGVVNIPFRFVVLQ